MKIFYKRYFRRILAMVCGVAMAVMSPCLAVAQTVYIDESVGCESLQYVVHSDAFIYFALNKLYEVDYNYGDALDYEEYPNCQFLGVEADGRLMLMEASKELVITDLFGEAERIVLMEGEEYILQYAMHARRLYYFCSDKKLRVCQVDTGETEVIASDTWVSYILADDDGVWYSDGAGLYRIDYETKAIELVIDDDVSYFQHVGDRIYYVATTRGAVRAYSLADGSQVQLTDVQARSLAIDETGERGVIVSRREGDPYWIDVQTGECRKIELAEGETIDALNASGGVLYLIAYSGTSNIYGQDLRTIYRMDEDKAVEVFKEGDQ